jgi:hypothetical protein
MRSWFDSPVPDKDMFNVIVLIIFLWVIYIKTGMLTAKSIFGWSLVTALVLLWMILFEDRAYDCGGVTPSYAPCFEGQLTNREIGEVNERR